MTSSQFHSTDSTETLTDPTTEPVSIHEEVPPFRSPHFWRSGATWQMFMGLGFIILMFGAFVLLTPFMMLGLVMFVVATVMVRIIFGLKDE